MKLAFFDLLDPAFLCKLDYYCGLWKDSGEISHFVPFFSRESVVSERTDRKKKFQRCYLLDI